MLEIEEELKLCREAAASAPSEWYWCLHHGVQVERLTEPVEVRIQYILDTKAGSEQALRFHNLRPVRVPLPKKLLKADAALDEARAALDEARAALDEARAALDEARAALNKAYATWAAVDKARAAFNEARDAFDKACAARDKAWAAVDKARAAFNEARNSPELQTLHNQDWPNTWNGKSIFP